MNAKWEYLDEKQLTAGTIGASRQNRGAYPILEAALNDWRMNTNDNQVPITGEMICQAASRLWHKMPNFAGMKEPSWSKGWLQRFKKRYNIKKYKQSGEAGSADLSPETLARIEELQIVCKEFAPKDIYNADETGLFWLMTPDTTLASMPQKGRKHIKSRITLHVCTNADGSDKLPLLILGNAKNPRAFGPKMRNTRDMNFRWDSNKNAWMTGQIMKEWLHWFDGKMAGRQVLLILDGFSSHRTAMTILDVELVNTRVEFLPPNCTSIFQPCDQGIINMLKVRYRKQWLEALVEATLTEVDAIKETSILRAVTWCIKAWQDVPAENIKNCWLKSQLLGRRQVPEHQPLATEVAECEKSLEELNIAPQERMTIEEFLNPPDENVHDPPADILDFIAENYLQEEDEEEPEPRTTLAEVHLSLKNSVDCVEKSDFDLPLDLLEGLRRAQQFTFRARRQEIASGRVQRSINDYFQST